MWEETEHICIYCGKTVNVKEFLLGFGVEVASGVGVFLAIAMLRTTFNLKLSYILIGFYLLVFVLCRGRDGYVFCL